MFWACPVTSLRTSYQLVVFLPTFSLLVCSVNRRMITQSKLSCDADIMFQIRHICPDVQASHSCFQSINPVCFKFLPVILQIILSAWFPPRQQQVSLHLHQPAETCSEVVSVLLRWSHHHVSRCCEQQTLLLRSGTLWSPSALSTFNQWIKRQKANYEQTQTKTKVELFI